MDTIIAADHEIAAADWLVREHTPAWLRLAGLTAHADALAALTPVRNLSAAENEDARALVGAALAAASDLAATIGATEPDIGPVAEAYVYDIGWSAATERLRRHDPNWAMATEHSRARDPAFAAILQMAEKAALASAAIAISTACGGVRDQAIDALYPA